MTKAMNDRIMRLESASRIGADRTQIEADARYFAEKMDRLIAESCEPKPSPEQRAKMSVAEEFAWSIRYGVGLFVPDIMKARGLPVPFGMEKIS